MDQAVFSRAYSQQDFCSFLRDFLPQDIQFSTEDFVIKKYKTITKACRIGAVPSLDLDIIEVQHNTADARIAISTDAFAMMADHSIHKALIIFTNGTNNYRFSLLTIDLAEDSKGKIVHCYSNPKRYSFFLGEDAKINTPYQQLINNGPVQDFQDLQSRFSLEVVNKAFYQELVGFFNKLVQEESETILMPSGQSAEAKKNFAVRLIGRIIFTWFLKQKKSEKGQLVPDSILSSGAVTAKEHIGGYYHSQLEILFFQLLNKPISQRSVRTEVFDLVPYLNGGLFTPHADDFYAPDPATNTSKYINTLRIADSWFADFFTFLETYNFTIDENTSFDQELSIDPEMLGRIFENLLAEIDAETGISARKATGSFYTPREIVDYMVDASLLEYFATSTSIGEKKLKAMISYDRDDDKEHPLTEQDKRAVIDAVASLKTLDPACGSGAFPIGMLQKLVYILYVVDEDGTRWRDKKLQDIPQLYRQKIETELRSQSKDYIRKLEVIKNSIFGVDIQPIAVEVSRLRAFLTLMVEEEIDDSRPNRGIEPLPNLEFKFVCANALIPGPKQQTDEQLFGDDFQESLKNAVDVYFSATGDEKTKQLERIKHLIDEKTQQEMRTFHSMATHSDPKMQDFLRQKKEKEQGEVIKKTNLWASYKNIFEHKPVGFFEAEYFFPSVEHGFDIVIGNPPYGVKFSKEDKKVFRKIYPESEFKIDSFSLFILKTLDLLDKNGVCIYIIPNTLLDNYFETKVRKKLLNETEVKTIIDLNDKVFDSAVVHSMIFSFVNRKSLEYDIDVDVSGILRDKFIKIPNTYFLGKPNSIFAIRDYEYKEVLDKIHSNSSNLNTILDLRQTIKSGNDKKYISEFSKGDNWKKILRGKDVDKFALNSPNLFIDYGKHLACPRDKKIFEQPKILIREAGSKVTAAYDDQNYYIMSSLYNGILIDDNYELKFILGLLMSDLFQFILNLKVFKKTEGAFTKAKIYHYDELPIRKCSKLEQEKISVIIEEILFLKSKNAKADIRDLENQINKLVYELYKVTPEEIEIVEESLRK